jgi:molybdopterin synthase sulfur carrier subunit
MTTLKIPTPLRFYTNGQAEVFVSGSNVAAAMRDLVGQYPTLEQHLYNNQGELRAFVNLFLGEDNIRDLQGLETALNDGDTLRLIPSIAGGSSRSSDLWCSNHYLGKYLALGSVPAAEDGGLSIIFVTRLSRQKPLVAVTVLSTSVSLRAITSSDALVETVHMDEG